MAVQPIPEGFHTVTPYLVIEDVANLIEFTKKAFGAEEMHRSHRPDGSIGHAAIRIGDSPVMMGGAMPEFPAMPASIYLYVPDTDAVYKRAIEAGGESLMEPADQFYGDRGAGVKDPCGNSWWIATHVEDVSPEEIEKRQAAMAK